MFDFSFLEMLVVFVVALLVLGPERLPKVARQLGWWMGRIRASVSNMRDELERETSIKDFRSATRDIEESVSETLRSTKSAVETAADAARDPAAAKPAAGSAAEAPAVAGSDRPPEPNKPSPADADRQASQ